MKTMHDRIRQARVAKKLTQAELANKLGVSPQSVQQWETKTEPKKTRLSMLSQELGVSANWLLFGEKQDGVSVKSINPTMIEEWGDDTPVDLNEVEVPYYKDIELAAGHGCNGGSSNHTRKLRFSRSTLRRYGIIPDNVAAFPVHGDSMEPIIPNGTTVFVNCGDKDIVDGGIYFIQQEDLLRVKILQRIPGGKLVIKSYNEVDYPDEEAGVDSVKVVGRVFNISVMLI